MFRLSSLISAIPTGNSRTTAVTGDTIPLTHLPVGHRARLIHSSAEPRLNRRLAEMGLTPGVALSILQDTGGPLLLSVRDARVALGRETADQLAVEVL